MSVFNKSETADTRFRVVRETSTLRHRVTEAIRESIAVGHYKAGSRMPEKELCTLTGVSRTLVREALRQLESEGLVQVIPHKGPIVASMTLDQAIGIYEVREVLESLAARRFAERASRDNFVALEEAYEHIRETYESGSAKDRLQAKNRFYDRLVEGSGNEAVGLALTMIHSRTMILRSHSLSNPERWKTSLQELRALLDALWDRDAEKAQELAVEHVRMAAKAALSSFQPGEATPAAPASRD